VAPFDWAIVVSRLTPINRPHFPPLIISMRGKRVRSFFTLNTDVICAAGAGERKKVALPSRKWSREAKCFLFSSFFLKLYIQLNLRWPRG
jgi:hypothetical protein